LLVWLLWRYNSHCWFNWSQRETARVCKTRTASNPKPAIAHRLSSKDSSIGRTPRFFSFRVSRKHTKRQAFRRNSPDADPFSQIAQNPEQAKVFDEAMATFAPVTAAAVTAAYDFSWFSKLVDVGGGNGALLTGILKVNPNLRGIVFDLPHVADKARNKIAEEGLQSRCEAIGGDFFKEVPSGADAYIIKHVIHDWNDQRAVAILKNIHRAMRRDGKLLIVEGVYPPRIDQSDISRGAAANDVNVLVCTGGRQRSEAEFRSLCEAAGFSLTRIVPTPAQLSVIEGKLI
jgi:SAM-dependent methyltransferase